MCAAHKHTITATDTKRLSKLRPKKKKRKEKAARRAIPLQEWSILLYLKYPLLHWQSATPSKSVHSEVSLSHSGSFCLHKLPTVGKTQPTSAQFSLNTPACTFAFPRSSIQLVCYFHLSFPLFLIILVPFWDGQHHNMPQFLAYPPSFVQADGVGE